MKKQFNRQKQHTLTTEAILSNNTPDILIVDDVRANLDVLSRILEEQGYQSRPVLSGKLALMSAKADPPDLILLDINMPEMDGFEVCKRLKADAVTKDIPVIFITAFTETADKVKAFSLGAVDYVTKPFQTGEIAARVQTHLKNRTLQRKLENHNASLEQMVAERTRELANVNRLKNDFLKMIAREIRTPVNGVLGMAELILNLCPASEDRTLYANVFQESSLRLLNLIEDTTLIVDIENVARNDRSAVPFSMVLDEIKTCHPELMISTTLRADPRTIFLHWNYALLKRVLETIILLAASFSADKHSVHVTVDVDAHALRMCLDIENLRLSEAEAADFFKMESTARNVSPAESMGLAPVAAYSIISAFGGEIRLIKGENNTGFLEAQFIKE